MVDPIAFKQSEKNTVRIEPKNHHHRWLKSSVATLLSILIWNRPQTKLQLISMQSIIVLTEIYI